MTTFIYYEFFISNLFNYYNKSLLTNSFIYTLKNKTRCIAKSTFFFGITKLPVP